MKLMLLAWLTAMRLTLTPWQTDMEMAKKTAHEKDRLILLNFSGSDWCGPCMRLRKEIFDAPAFSGMADSSLVLLNADFPRNKKNQLPKAQQQHNDALADQYNPQGKFPFTLLLTADGKVLRSWEGFPSDARQFVQQIKSLADANHH